jgi:hypothetical protein
MEKQDLQSTQQRPAGVLILAIITILGSALTIVGGLLLPENFSGLPEGMPQSPAWVTALTMVSALIKLGGAILLIQMRRWGFFTYLAGELLTVFLNLKTGFDLIHWSGEANTSAMPIDPVVFALGLVGAMLLLSVIWVGVYAAYLPRMR